MKKNLFKRVAAVVLAGTMMMAMGTTVFAADGETGTEAQNAAVTFTKTLDMSGATDASIPDVTFEFEIEPGNAVDIAQTEPKVLEGIGNPTIADVVFSQESQKDGDNNPFETATVSFEGITFEAPGIYRYVITEKPIEDAATNGQVCADITNDANSTRYLDVYVNNAGVITGYAVYEAETESYLPTPVTVDGKEYNEYSGKKGYTNKYTTYSLTLDKKVTGNMGDLDKEFDFTIEFVGPKNAVFQYVLTKDGVTNNPTAINLDENGKETINFKLANGDKIVVTGIPSMTEYNITESINVNEGYTTKITETNGVEKNDFTTGEVVMGKKPNTVTFTNHKDGITPTGIIMNVAPYVAMVAVAVVLAVVFLGRKRREF